MNEHVSPRPLPPGATLPPWLEEVKPYYFSDGFNTDMKMMTRAEISALEGSPMSDERWDVQGSTSGSDFGHPWYRIKE